MRKKRKPSRKILRFNKSDRKIHWTIAAPFLVCYMTALVLIWVYNPDPSRPFRDVVSCTHRISGACVVMLPLIAMFLSRHDIRFYIKNINQAWLWTIKDFRCLIYLAFSAVLRRNSLPENISLNTSIMKYNYAAAMILVSFYPFYALTGAILWLTKGLLLFWIIHFGLAAAATPLLAVHVIMSAVSPATRVIMSGKISDFVERRSLKRRPVVMKRRDMDNIIIKQADEITAEPEDMASPGEEIGKRETVKR